MKKLFKKFVILALISTMIGYNATKDKASENTYTEPTETIESVQDVEQEELPLSFQLVEEDVVETVPVKVTVEEKKEILAPVSTKEPEIVEKKVEVPIVVETKPVATSTPTPLSTPIVTPTPEPVVEATPQPTVIPTPTPTPQPTQTPEPTPIPTPKPTPTPIPTPKSTPTPVPPFDINYWIGFAQNYAQSIDLVLESSAIDCWDNPIPAGHHCKNIEQNITDRLNRYKNLEGFTDVWIWSVETGANTYDIYIGYA